MIFLSFEGAQDYILDSLRCLSKLRVAHLIR